MTQEQRDTVPAPAAAQVLVLDRWVGAAAVAPTERRARLARALVRDSQRAAVLHAGVLHSTVRGVRGRPPAGRAARRPL